MTIAVHGVSSSSSGAVTVTDVVLEVPVVRSGEVPGRIVLVGGVKVGGGVVAGGVEVAGGVVMDPGSVGAVVSVLDGKVPVSVGADPGSEAGTDAPDLRFGRAVAPTAERR
jgi:hypothetical protein